MDDEIKFVHPLKDIDSWILAEDQGQSMMLTKIQKLEMEIRRKQLKADEYGFDEYEDDEFIDLEAEHQKLTEDIKKANEATHKTDAAFRPLKPQQQQQLEEDMAVSIVRNDASSEYNKTDDELFGDQERREILQRLSRIRNIYYDPISYRAAILTIKEAIEYSLRHDYPWLQSYEEAVQQFNEGKIKYQGNIPKLYLGFGTNQVTDPQILAGIVSGEVQVVDKDEEEKELKKRRKQHQEYTPVKMEYDVVRSNEYQQLVKLHNMGYDTPISVILKNKSQLFDRLSMPFTFASQTQQKETKIEDLEFNWFQDNAGEIFYCEQNGIKRNTQSNMISILNKENNGELNPYVSQSMQEFLYSFAHPEKNQGVHIIEQSKPLEPSTEALQLENNLLEAIRRNNPNL